MYLLFLIYITMHNKRTRLCLLESLNTDVLIAILAACGSFSDLASFIRASLTALHAFVSAKATVLLHIAGNILGPATRDAAFLAQTLLFDGEDHERKVDAGIQDYRARLCVTSPPWVMMIGADDAVASARLTSLTQFFVDLFVYFRFRYFTQRSNLPQSHLSWAEHGRIAQALLRRQLFVLMHGGKSWEPRDYPRFIRTVFSLFHVGITTDLRCGLFSWPAALHAGRLPNEETSF